MLQHLEVLAALITPAVLISAAALLLLSTANRLGRVNDRLQGLMAEAEQLQQQSDQSEFHKKKHELVLEQLKCLLKRMLLLRTAVTGIYVTIALLIMASIAAGIGAAFPGPFSLIASSVAVLATIAFLCSTSILIREASIAVQITLHEVAYVRQLLNSPPSRHGKFVVRERQDFPAKVA